MFGVFVSAQFAKLSTQRIDFSTCVVGPQIVTIVDAVNKYGCRKQADV